MSTSRSMRIVAITPDPGTRMLARIRNASAVGRWWSTVPKRGWVPGDVATSNDRGTGELDVEAQRDELSRPLRSVGVVSTDVFVELAAPRWDCSRSLAVAAPCASVALSSRIPPSASRPGLS